MILGAVQVYPIVIFLASLSLGFIVFPGLELGKRLMGMQIIDANGTPISFGRTLGRSFVRSLLLAITWIGAFTADGRFLHDQLFDTYVVYKV